MLTWGWKQYAKVLAVLTLVCKQCAMPAEHVVRGLTTKFTLFFIPLFPVGRKHTVTCTACRAEVKVPREQAERMAAGGEGQPVQAHAPFTGPPTPAYGPPQYQGGPPPMPIQAPPQPQHGSPPQQYPPQPQYQRGPAPMQPPRQGPPQLQAQDGYPPQPPGGYPPPGYPYPPGR